MSEQDETDSTSGDAEGGTQLQPARPDTGDDERAFAHRLPWKWFLGGTLVVAIVLGGYWFRREAEANALRAQILRVSNGDLAPIGVRFTGFLTKIEGWVIAEAQRSAPERFVDPRLRVASLGSAQGLYLRVAATDATDPDKLAAAALQMGPDAITSCLGITPASARTLYALKGFLGPELAKRANATTSVMGLRVIDDELRRHMASDLPPIANLLQADWFLLVLERGENRRDFAVDVYLWDLRRNQRLLSVRTQANGVLIPVRIAMPGVTPAARPRQNLQTGGASDCSIASQIKALTGEASATFGSDVAAFEAVETMADGGVPHGDGGEIDGGSTDAVEGAGVGSR